MPKTAADLVHNKKSSNFRSWLHTALNPLVAYRLDSSSQTSYGKSPEEMKLNLEWIHGIRCQDTKRCLKYSIGREYAEQIDIMKSSLRNLNEFNEEIIYFISNTVILLNMSLNR